MIYAPIVIPTLCRSKHFIRLVESLKKNSWASFTDVYVGLDYPPSEKYKKGWAEICEYLDKSDFSVFAKFVVVRRETNYGSARNSAELNRLVQNKYDRWIRTDDDCEFSPNFLEYMDKCLDKYEDDEKIVAVTGYSYPVDWAHKEHSTCIRQNINLSMWGTGFWVKKRLPIEHEISSGKLLRKVRHVLKYRLNERMIDICFADYMISALAFRKKTKKLFLGCTDVSMRAYLAIEDKFCITPVVSKVRNYGFDGSGVFCSCIEEKDFGVNAKNYNYPKQEIDCSESFEIELDDDEENLKINRAKLNSFDPPLKKSMKRAQLYAVMVRMFGITCAKVLVAFFFGMSKIFSRVFGR